MTSIAAIRGGRADVRVEIVGVAVVVAGGGPRVHLDGLDLEGREHKGAEVVLEGLDGLHRACGDDELAHEEGGVLEDAALVLGARDELREVGGAQLGRHGGGGRR